MLTKQRARHTAHGRMLKARIVTAAVLLGIFLSALFFLPTELFAVPIGFAVAVGSLEWAVLAKVTGWKAMGFAALCTGLFASMVWILKAMDPAQPLVASLYALATVFWLFVAPLCIAGALRFKSARSALAIGVVVVVPAGLSIISLHFIGPGALLLILTLIWTADTAAFFAGRAFGRHKLAPTISPGKTWEGAAGALVATLIFAAVSAVSWAPLSIMVHEYGWLPYLALTGFLCVLSIEGDLFESLVKRQAQAKDSGTLLPGHGGMLDRIDSITSTLPVATLMFYVHGKLA